ncbi:Titin [Wickerhamiella sorbophila]|uniref:Titin n=1 Tax=Wickerhamiella sorbophila TaxID=45607 RepID=A0A2T0FID8_9ASCO|nr:Titin [Wickerhamiella sorbophila]PRT54762.1 Titin [Wickerhamiella sorbophila]
MGQTSAVPSASGSAVPSGSAPASASDSAVPSGSAPASAPGSDVPSGSVPASAPGSDVPSGSAPASAPDSAAPSGSASASAPGSAAPSGSASASAPGSDVPSGSAPASAPDSAAPSGSASASAPGSAVPSGSASASAPGSAAPSGSVPASAPGSDVPSGSAPASAPDSAAPSGSASASAPGSAAPSGSASASAPGSAAPSGSAPGSASGSGSPSRSAPGASASSVPSGWATYPLPPVSCPPPSKDTIAGWFAGIKSAIDVLIGSPSKILDLAKGVEDVICALGDAKSKSPSIVDIKPDLVELTSVAGKISSGLIDLAGRADSISTDITARSLFARADTTLPKYIEDLLNGVVDMIFQFEAAVTASGDCADYSTLSSNVVLLGSAMSSLEAAYSVSSPIPPTLAPDCPMTATPSSNGTSSGAPTSGPSSGPSSGVPSGPASGPSSGTPSETPCPTCPPIPCPTCIPVCTASPCLPVCEVCKVVPTVVETLTTYCSGPTTICFNDVCHTATAETTLTITDCPCTIYTAVTPSPLPSVHRTIIETLTLGGNTVVATHTIGAVPTVVETVTINGSPVISTRTLAGVPTLTAGEATVAPVQSGAAAPGVSGIPVGPGAGNSGIVAANGASSLTASLMVVFAALFTFF